MPLFPIPIEEFGGLDLTNDPSEVGFSGAIDLLNVDFDKPGRVRSRDGYTKVNAVAAGGNFLNSLYSFGSRSSNFLVAGSTDMYCYSNSGSLLGTGVGYGTVLDAQAIGTGAAGPYVYIANENFSIKRLAVNPRTFTTPGGMPTASMLALQPVDNRLVVADNTAGSGCKVQFSDAGAPETFSANNYVELAPNDEDALTCLATWNNFVFAFKNDSYYVFYGNSTDASGNPVFNYRPVRVGVGAYGLGKLRSTVAAPEGLYFWHTSGVYVTTGGAPVKVSHALDPLFNASAAPAFFTSSITQPIAPLGMTHFADRLYISVEDGGNNYYTLIYTPATQSWNVWQTATPTTGIATVMYNGTTPCVMFTSNATTKYIYRFDPTATTDDGTGISARYQSGFDNLAPPRRFAAHYLFGNTRKRFRKWKVTGTGNVTLGIAHEMGAVGQTQALTLGVSPAIKDAWFNKAVRGQLVSYRLSSTTPFSVNKLTAYLAGSEPPLLGDPSDT